MKAEIIETNGSPKIKFTPDTDAEKIALDVILAKFSMSKVAYKRVDDNFILREVGTEKDDDELSKIVFS